MKKIVFAFILQLTLISGFSQNVTGNWQGILTHPEDTIGFTDNYAFWLTIEQEGDKITGYSRIELANSKNYSVMKFEGTFNNNHLSVVENAWEESHMGKGIFINWCLKRVSLIYTWEDSTESLRGVWSSSKDCGPGEIYVYRSPEEFNARTAQSYDYVSFSEFKRMLKDEESVLGQKVILPKVTFDAYQAYLIKDARPVLKELKEIMNEYPNLKITILGHTGNLGNDQFNLILSHQRAKTVKDYLTKMGISESRLQYQGFGESRPVAPNNTEEGRRKNRRIEFEIVSE
ncbi:MAG: OmpA family protein [Crocinitomicaceae bacterium]